MKIKINFPGPLTTVVDEGRKGFMNVGFSLGGAMDKYSMSLANILVGNSEDEGVLDEEQCDLLQNALDFDEVLAFEIITPRVDMQSIDIRERLKVLANL